MKNYWYVVFVVLALYMIVHIEIKAGEEFAPESVVIRVLKADNRTPETEAECKADIITNEMSIDDKRLNKIESMFEYVDLYSWDVKEDKGFYELETGMEGYKGDFEIRIVCVSPGFKGVSYTILNNNNVPCELRDDGRFLIC